MTVDQLLTDCFSRYQAAKKTILANMPSQYNQSATPASPAALPTSPTNSVPTKKH
jgi:hypothetical protein